MICPSDETSCCPFAFNENSEVAQSYGCLPSPWEIIQMRQKHNKTWACHNDISKPCIGAIQYMKEKGMSHVVVDPVLVTEDVDWSMYV